MSYENYGTLAEEKYQARIIAHELCYERVFPNIMEVINRASTIGEVQRIMATARRRI